jgi:hypothetical protein
MMRGNPEMPLENVAVAGAVYEDKPLRWSRAGYLLANECRMIARYREHKQQRHVSIHVLPM